MARAPEYISAPKEEIMTQNYSLMQHFVLVTQGMRPPKGEVYVPTESPRGELGFFIHSLGEAYPQRMKIKTPSFAHTSDFTDAYRRVYRRYCYDCRLVQCDFWRGGSMRLQISCINTKQRGGRL